MVPLEHVPRANKKENNRRPPNMSHSIHITVEFSNSKASIADALKPYFIQDTLNLCFQRILPCPRQLEGRKLKLWLKSNWSNCPYIWRSNDKRVPLPHTSYGEIQDNRYTFTVENQYPETLLLELTGKVGQDLLVTSWSCDDMNWSQAEFQRSGRIRPIYYATYNGHMEGNVPKAIKEEIEEIRKATDLTWIINQIDAESKPKNTEISVEAVPSGEVAVPF